MMGQIIVVAPMAILGALIIIVCIIGLFVNRGDNG